MAFLLPRTLRTVSRSACRLIKPQVVVQRQSFQSSAFLRQKEEDKEEMDDLKKNPYFDKYADKIAKMQQTSPEEFLDRLGKTEEEKSRKKELEQKGYDNQKDFSLPTKPKGDVRAGSLAQSQDRGNKKSKKESGGTGQNEVQKLNDVMKLDLLAGKTKEEIADLWREFHSKKDSVAAVIPAEMFSQMQERFLEFKTFLFPLPRKQGYEFIVVQFDGKQAHFTTLINFQAYKENAPECLTLVHYTELAEEKGIVLMVGEYDTKVLSYEEASCLGVQTLLYYGGDSEKMRTHLNRFQYETDDFNHYDLIAELEVAQNVPLAPLFRG